MPRRVLMPPALVELALSRGARRFEVVCRRWFIGCRMVQLRCSVVFVGMVVGGRGTPWCCQPGGRRPGFDPCMRGWVGVGRLVCGLFDSGFALCDVIQTLS